MATVSTPISAWIATIHTGASIGVGSSVTSTVNITAGWEVQLPVKCQFSNVSSDPIVNIYPSMDGGTTYDTTPFTSFSIARIATAPGQASIRLSTGQYVIEMKNINSAGTVTFIIPTALVITAINNV